ncbi:MAG: hypothetical protein U9Q81_26190 [Pseudomonadota bacterium]|nr:hypothetical protein [Pseudomonadota bacterium]
MRTKAKLRYCGWLGPFVLAGCAGLAAFTVQAKQDYYLVDRQNMACILANLEEYMQTAGDVLVIIASRCPQTGFTDDDILRESQNTLPQIGKFPPGTEIDNVIVFPKRQFRCLKRHSDTILRSQERYIKIPKTLCR